jgi:tetratricopeptide (TPR) repeat protein
MTLTSLQDKSLLRFNSARRYEFQPVLQQYAEDKFRKSQEEFDRVQSAHAEYYSSFLQARSDPILAQEETVLAEIGTEIENVRSAWQWAVEHKSFEHLARSVDALFIFYQIRGWYEEGNQVFSSAIEMMRGNVDSGPEQETTSGKILACQGAFQLRLGVPAKARELLEESRDIFQRNDANEEIGFCLNFLGLTARMQGEFDEAKGFLDQALSVNQETGDRFEEALSLQNLGTVAFSQGEYQEAHQLFQSSLESRTRIGERQGIAYSLNNLALVANLLGEYDESDRYFQESYSAFETIGNRWGMATCLNNRSYGRYLQGDYEEGYQQYDEALTIFKEIGDRWATGNCLIGMGDLSVAQEDNQGAADHYTEAMSICDDIGAVPLVLYAVVSLANLLAKEGLMESGVELMTLAVEHPSTEQEAKDRGAQILEELEAQMPAEAFVKAQSSGRAMSLDDAVTRILRA